MPVANTTIEKLSEARAKMMRTSFLWGSLSMNLKLVESDKYQTLATDATTLWANPKWVDKQNPEELVGSMAYETVKCALNHPFRIPGGADMDLVNQASSKVAYTIVQEAGYRLPQDAVSPAFDEEGLCFEDLLHMLTAKKRKQEQDKKGNKNGKEGKKSESGSSADESGNGKSKDEPESEQGTGGKNDPADAGKESKSEGTTGSPDAGKPGTGKELATGEIVPAGQGAEASDEESEEGTPGETPVNKMTEVDWQIAVEQALMVATKAGHLGANAKMLIEVGKESRTSLREHLMRFMEQTKASYVSWSKTNRRMGHLGYHLPSSVKHNMPKVAIITDTSGSVWWYPGLPQQFGQVTSDVMSEMKPERIDVYYADTDVQQIQSFEPNEEIILENIGGGGTKFGPAIEAVMKAHEEENYCCIIYLTDMDNDPKEVLTEPDLPILWVAPNWAKRPAPFGELVKMSEVEI